MNGTKHQAAVQRVQTQQLFAASNTSLITGVILAAIFAYMQSAVVATTEVLAWLSLIVLVTLARAALVIAYQRGAHDEAGMDTWLTIFRIGVFASGLAWGLSCLLLFPAGHPLHQMLLIFVLTGLTAGGIISFSADLFSAISYSALLLVSLATRLFVAGDHLSVAMTVAVLLYLGFMVMSLRYINSNMSENIVLRFEAKVREEAVKASEQRYRLLLQHSPVGILHYDTNLIITYCNDYLAGILHSSVERLAGLDLNALRDQSILPAMRKIIEEENGYYEGYYRATFSGADGWISMTCAPSRDGKGKVVGGIAIVQDITARKKAEAALHHSNRAFATLSAVNRNLVHGGDESSLLQVVCRSIVEQCGYRLAWVGYLQHDAEKSIRPVAQYGYEQGYLEQAGIVWSDTEKGRGPTGKAARSGQIQIAQNILTDDNMLPWREQAMQRGYASSIALPLGYRGAVFGVLTIYAEQPDAFGQAEAELLQEMAADLEFGIESLRARMERDAALDQLRRTADQLAQTNAQLEAERATLAQRVERRTRQLLLANKAKDSFLATMSHEIRTPLGGLLGMMELLGLSQLQPHQSELLAAAQTSGNSLLRIVNDILDWSKIEAGKLELAPRPATFTDMLRSVVNTYAQIATEKDIRLSYSIDPELRGAHLFDPLRLSQILNNFTSNALKFTASGTIHLSAQRLTHHTGYDTVRFSVTDSGIGIDPEHRARLFQHYEQASADTARMYGGTGLGLSICRRLAELMDGELSVDSTPGVGSTFSLTLQLPIANVALAADPQQPTAPDPEPDTSPLVAPGQTLAVLMVDDHPLNRMLLKQQLGLLGLHPDAAADGVEALALWQSHHYDLIITDCHMPEMDGYELTRTIRDIERHTGARRIPIIAWTANVLAEEQHRCQAAGMDDLLTKPTELAELRAKLAHWLAKARLLPATGPSVPPAAPPRTTPAAAVLDLGVLNKISTRRDAQIEMLQEFKLHNRSDIASLQAALKAGDPVAVVQAAHRGKGACRMVGALELAGLCADIEQTARQGALPEAGVADRLEAAVGRVEAEIGKFVG